MSGIPGQFKAQELIDASPAVISVIDTARWQVEHQNRAGAKALGDIVGTSCHWSIAGYEEQCPFCRAEEVLATQTSLSAEVAMADGRWLLIQWAPVVQQGQTRALETITEITEQKRQQEEYRRLKADHDRVAGTDLHTAESDSHAWNESPSLQAEKGTEGFPQRLAAALRGTSINDVSRRSGVSEGTIRGYLKETPGLLKRLVQIARATGVSLDWLATGEESGELGRGPSSGLRVTPEEGTLGDQNRPLGELVLRREWLHEKGLQEQDLVLVRADGDAMKPWISDGDLLLVDTSQRNVAREGVFVLRLDGCLVAKRLQLDFTGGIYIRSEDATYETLHLRGEDRRRLEVVGRVVWAGVEFD